MARAVKDENLAGKGHFSDDSSILKRSSKHTRMVAESVIEHTF